MIELKLPEKSVARLGSENQELYVAYSDGFNTCREIVKMLNPSGWEVDGSVMIDEADEVYRDVIKIDPHASKLTIARAVAKHLSQSTKWLKPVNEVK